MANDVSYSDVQALATDLSAELGTEVTVNMIRAWCAESKTTKNLLFHRSPAWIKAAGPRLRDWFCDQCGGRFLPEKQAERLQRLVARIQDDTTELAGLVGKEVA